MSAGFNHTGNSVRTVVDTRRRVQWITEVVRRDRITAVIDKLNWCRNTVGWVFYRGLRPGVRHEVDNCLIDGGL
jgi:hypothetical protein